MAVVNPYRLGFPAMPPALREYNRENEANFRQNVEQLLKQIVVATNTTVNTGNIFEATLQFIPDNTYDVGDITGPYRPRTVYAATSVITPLVTATTLGGTLSTASQPNITTVGTLLSLTVAGTTTLNGSTVLGDATADLLTGTATVARDWHPQDVASGGPWSLGTSTKRWARLALGTGATVYRAPTTGTPIGNGLSLGSFTRGAPNWSFEQFNAESGSDTGSDLILTRWSDISVPTIWATITRSTGAYAIVGDGTLTGTMNISGATTLQSAALTINGLSYTWPASQAANRVLRNTGPGTLAWSQVDLSTDVTGALATGTVPLSQVTAGTSPAGTFIFPTLKASVAIQPVATDTVKIGQAGAGFVSLAIEHNSSRADGLLLLQTLTGQNSPRLFFNNTTDWAGAACAIFQNASNTLTFTTGATPGTASGTARWSYTAAGIFPAVTNAMTLGNSSFVWSNVAATRMTAPLLGTTSGVDVVIDRNSVTQLTLGSLTAVFAGTVTAGSSITATTGNISTTDGILIGIQSSGIMLRQRNSSGTVDVRQWEPRVSAAGAYELRSTTDAGTTVVTAMQLAHATGAATFVSTVQGTVLTGTTRITSPLLGTTTGVDTVLDRNSVAMLTLGATSATFSKGNLTLTPASAIASIHTDTVDGADNAVLKLAAGGVESSTRGAVIQLFGNEHANTGQIILNSGNVTGATVLIQNKGVTKVTVDDSLVTVATALTITGALSGVTTASMSGQLTSTLATGTAPFVVASTTKVANLNADLLDDQTGSYYNDAANLTGTIASARLSGSYTGITGVGTLTAGTWNASVISEAYGGTNQSTYTLGDLLYASATNTLSKLAGNITTTPQYLRQTGNGSVSAAPVWDTLTAADVGAGTFSGAFVFGSAPSSNNGYTASNASYISAGVQTTGSTFTLLAALGFSATFSVLATGSGGTPDKAVRLTSDTTAGTGSYLDLFGTSHANAGRVDLASGGSADIRLLPAGKVAVTGALHASQNLSVGRVITSTITLADTYCAVYVNYCDIDTGGELRLDGDAEMEIL